MVTTQQKNRQNRRAPNSRRDFAKAIAATALAATTAPLTTTPPSATAQTSQPKAEAPAPPNPKPTASDSPLSSPLALAYAEVVRSRFGEKMTPDEFDKIKRDLESNLRTAERLRLFKLKITDEPDFIFSA